jgi:REP element-mobilizing transposase RayT
MCLAEETGANQSSGLRLIEKLFLDLLGQTCGRTGRQIHAYCPMDNHFHLVVETPRSNLSAGFRSQFRPRALGEDVAWDEVWESLCAREYLTESQLVWV